MYIISLKAHGNLQCRQSWAYCPRLIDGEAQTSSVSFPRLPSKQMSRQKTRSYHIRCKISQLQGMPEAGGAQEGKELLVCPTFRDESANSVISHCAEWILISWFFFFFCLFHFFNRLCSKGGQRFGDNIPRGRAKIRAVEMIWVSSASRDRCHLLTSFCLEKRRTPNLCETEKC